VASDPMGDVFVARSETQLSKLDGNGTLLWSQPFGTLVATDALGNVHVAGSFTGTLTLGASELRAAGGSDVYLAELDPNGTLLSAVALGGAADDRALSLVIDSERNAILSGSGLGTVKLDANANVLWSKDFYGHLAVDAIDDVLLAGALTETTDFGGGALSSAGAADVFVVKLSASGEHRFSRRFGDAAEQRAEAIAVDHANDLLISGVFAGNVDFGAGVLSLRPGACPEEVGCQTAGFVTKLSASGDALWSVSRGPMRALPGLSVGAQNTVVLSGAMPGNVRPYHIPFAARLRADGAELWQRSEWPKTGIGAGHDIVVDPCDNLLWSVSAVPSLGSDERPYLAKLLL